MNDDQSELSEDSVALRRDDAIRRALNTPPSPLKAKPKKRPKAALSAASDPSAPKAS